MTIYGLDLLGGVKYKDLLLGLKQKCAIGLFDNTFGDASKLVEALIGKGFDTFRIQLVWKDNHGFGDAEMIQATRAAKKYERLKQRFPNVIIYLSPFCEHKIKSVPLLERYLDQVAKVAPSCQIVNTSISGGAFSKKIY
jgi:hypothetical protein